MANIIEMIAGESLVIKDILQDDGSDTPFPINSICSATAYDKYKKIIGAVVNGTRGSDVEPFEVVFSKDDTESWDGNISVVVEIEYEDGIVAAKDKLRIKCEKFG